jgi:hypothetical protein
VDEALTKNGVGFGVAHLIPTIAAEGYLI